MYTFLCHSGSYRAGGAITESWQGVVYCCCSNRRLSRKSLTAEKGEGLALQYPPLIADTCNTRASPAVPLTAEKGEGGAVPLQYLPLTADTFNTRAKL